MATEAAVLAAWLLWPPRAGGSRDESSSTPSPTTTNGPEECAMDTDCGDTNQLMCDYETSRCVCRDVYSVLSPARDCHTVKQLGEACSFDAQCEFFDRHASCLEGTCACSSGFYILPDRNGSLCDPGGVAVPGGPTGTTLSTMDVNMIIIVVCLAVMFLGICVALHLFSKARFRNRRTIFNSPHPRLMHIKLGRKKTPQRRPSHINVPPTARHHSFSVYQSPLPSRPVHKTRSDECLRSISPPKFSQSKLNDEAPLAEKESLPSIEDLAKKTPELLKNGPAVLKASAAVQNGPSSPTVIVTDADGSHTIVSNKSPSPPLNV